MSLQQSLCLIILVVLRLASLQSALTGAPLSVAPVGIEATNSIAEEWHRAAPQSLVKSNLWPRVLRSSLHSSLSFVSVAGKCSKHQVLGPRSW